MKCGAAVTCVHTFCILPCASQVVLACGPSLDCGFARQLLLHWAPNDKNTVCFVERAQVGQRDRAVVWALVRVGTPVGIDKEIAEEAGGGLWVEVWEGIMSWPSLHMTLFMETVFMVLVLMYCSVVRL